MSKRAGIDYIKVNRDRFTVKIMCYTLSVSEAGYYQHQRRLPVCKAKHSLLLAQIYELLIEEEENANDGVRRIYDYLRLNKGYTGGIRTIYRICKDNNLMICCKNHANGITKADV